MFEVKGRVELLLPLGPKFVHNTVMPTKGGRPKTGHDPLVAFGMPKEMAAEVDASGATQDPPLGRSEAIRELLRRALDQASRRSR